MPVDLGMGTTWAKCHACGTSREVQVWLYKINNFAKEGGLKFQMVEYDICDGPGLEPLQDFMARSSFIVNSEL